MTDLARTPTGMTLHFHTAGMTPKQLKYLDKAEKTFAATGIPFLPGEENGARTWWIPASDYVLIRPYEPDDELMDRKVEGHDWVTLCVYTAGERVKLSPKLKQELFGSFPMAEISTLGLALAYLRKTGVTFDTAAGAGARELQLDWSLGGAHVSVQYAPADSPFTGDVVVRADEMKCGLNEHAIERLKLAFRYEALSGDQRGRLFMALFLLMSLGLPISSPNFGVNGEGEAEPQEMVWELNQGNNLRMFTSPTRPPFDDGGVVRFWIGLPQTRDHIVRTVAGHLTAVGLSAMVQKIAGGFGYELRLVVTLTKVRAF